MLLGPSACVFIESDSMMSFYLNFKIKIHLWFDDF